MAEKSKTNLLCFIPNKFYHLTKSEFVTFENQKIKTDYLISIMNDLIQKYYRSKDNSFRMYSLILKNKYGQYYNYYINYLLDKGFMKIKSNYYSGLKSRTYEIIITHLSFIKRCRVDDKYLMKKSTKEYHYKLYTKYTNSPIVSWVRERVISDLYYVNTDIKKALEYINEKKENNEIDYNKYWKNVTSIENLQNDQIFFNFDTYGRLHTNYTTLKREIRKDYVTIGDDDICELDVVNSQPLFLCKFMIDNMPKKDIIKPDVTKYIELVTNGLIYEEIMHKCGLSERKYAKDMIYKVLFGVNTENGDKNKFNKHFYKLFPTVYNYIMSHKIKAKDHRVISHKLQQLESDFIFNLVIAEVYEKIPDIKLFTVHDSICFPCKYYDDVKKIFDYHKNRILKTNEN